MPTDTALIPMHVHNTLAEISRWRCFEYDTTPLFTIVADQAEDARTIVSELFSLSGHYGLTGVLLRDDSSIDEALSLSPHTQLDNPVLTDHVLIAQTDTADPAVIDDALRRARSSGFALILVGPAETAAHRYASTHPIVRPAIDGYCDHGNLESCTHHGRLDNPQPPAERAQAIIESLSRFTFHGQTEADYQEGIELALTGTGTDVDREAVLSPRNRIDFLSGTVGIEVKTRGSRAAIIRQLGRYAREPRIEALILATPSRKILTGLPTDILGVPVVGHLLEPNGH